MTFAKKHIFGKVAAYIYIIEFQKRSLPHAHIQTVLKSEDKVRCADDVDQIVSAKIPDPAIHPRLHGIVLKHMVHGPCGALNSASPCMSQGRCTEDFPKAFANETNLEVNGYPVYRQRNTGMTYNAGKHFVDSRWVVPLNPWLLLKYNCHINVEICASITSVKYLFKYTMKSNNSLTPGTLVHPKAFDAFLDLKSTNNLTVLTSYQSTYPEKTSVTFKKVKKLQHWTTRTTG